MIAASIQECMFITVTCCEEIAKKLSLQLFILHVNVTKPPGKTVVCMCVPCIQATAARSSEDFQLQQLVSMRPQHCLANSTTFQNPALRFAALSTTKLIFQVLEILQTQFQDFAGAVGTLASVEYKQMPSHDQLEQTALD